MVLYGNSPCCKEKTILKCKRGTEEVRDEPRSQQQNLSAKDCLSNVRSKTNRKEVALIRVYKPDQNGEHGGDDWKGMEIKEKEIANNLTHPSY